MKPKHPVFFAAAAIVACVFWSSAFAGVKIGLKYWPPITLAGVRFIISGLLLAPFWLSYENRPFLQIRDNIKTILYVALFQTFLLYLFFNLGMTKVAGAMASIVIGASPLTMAVVAHMATHDDKLKLRKMVCMLIGFSGIVLISVSRKPFQAGNLAMLGGVVMLLIASVSSAIGNLVVSKHKGNVNPLLLNSMQILLGGVALLIVALPIEGLPSFQQPYEFYVALSWLAFLSAAAFTVWFMLLKQPGVHASDLNLWKFIIPVFGTLFSWIFLDEKITLKLFIGMIIVAFSVFCYYVPVNVNKGETS